MFGIRVGSIAVALLFGVFAGGSPVSAQQTPPTEPAPAIRAAPSAQATPSVQPTPVAGPSGLATRTWVSGLGDDVNPCSYYKPCKTFAGAMPNTAAGGEVNCLDQASYGAVTITKSMSIICDRVQAGVLAPAYAGVLIAAGPSDVITLRGLDIEGAGGGTYGIRFDSGGTLHVQDCLIRGFGGNPGQGIFFAPSGTSQLFVENTVISESSKAATSAGILVQPIKTGSARGVIENVKLLNGGSGLIVDGTQTTGAEIDIVLRNSTASGNALYGVGATTATGHPAVEVIINHTTITSNNIGIASTGAGTDVTLAYSIVGTNNTGLTFTAPATLRSYLTNQLRTNLVQNGAPSGPAPLE